MDDLVDDPETVAALFETAAVDLPPPVAILREPDGPRGVARFVVRTRGAAYRMKVGVDPSGADAVARGARALVALERAGVTVARGLALAERPGRPTVAVETRLGTTDAGVAWPVLGREGRDRVLGDAVAGLLRLHALSLDVVPGGSAGGWRERVHRCADRQLARLDDRGDIDASLLAAARRTLRRGLDAMPCDLRPVPCHGAPGLREIAVERRAFAGWRDFEAMRAGDPWLDLAHLAFMADGPESATPTLPTVVAAASLAGTVPPDLSTRLSLYLLLTVATSLTASPLPVAAECATTALETALGWSEDRARRCG
jgi:aminoglycoside phosphotransferase (APT) family kinase protein